MLRHEFIAEVPFSLVCAIILLRNHFRNGLCFAPEMYVISDTSVRMWPQSRHYRGSRRCANGLRTIGAFENETLLTQPSHIRCFNVVIPEGGKRVIALLVGPDEKQIWFPVHDNVVR